MAVALLTITHEEIGASLLATAQAMLVQCPLAVAHLKVSAGADPDTLLIHAHEMVRLLDSGEGVLILTDIYGATPANIALRLSPEPRMRVVSGINLPMLVRVLNYPDLSLDELADKALSGGHDGIIAS